MKKIVISLIGAGICHLATHYGTQFERYQICFKPSESYDDNCQANIDLVVLKQLYDLDKYGEGNNSDLKRDWIEVIKKTRIIANLPASNPMIPLYSLSTVAGLFLAAQWQGQKVKQLQVRLAANVEAYASETYLTWSEGYHDRRVKHQLNEFKGDRTINVEMNKLKSNPELAYLQKQFERQEELVQASHLNRLEHINTDTEKERADKYEHIKRGDKALPKGTQSLEPAQPTEAEKKQALCDALKRHEDGWLHTLVTTPKSLLVVGKKGSFKSCIAATMAMCQVYLESYVLEQIVDPDYHKSSLEGQAWFHTSGIVKNTYGSNETKDGTDWESVIEGMDYAMSLWNKRTPQDKPHLISIFDELTLYAGQPEVKALASEFIRQLVSRPRKANCKAIGIAHGITNAMTGGSEGFNESIKQNTIQLYLNSDNEEKPLFKGRIEGFVDSNGEDIKEYKITIPGWFRPDKIYNYLWKNKELEF